LYDTRARTTAGVTLEMETDSRNLFLSVEVSNAFRNLCFSHSILVNGKRIGELRGSVPKESQTVAMEAQFDLGPGSKLVQIVFPWSANSMIKSLQIDDGARVVPVAKKRKMLIFGDSITQGYDAYYPENAYAVRLTQYLNASAINKSIGGIKYYPQLAKLPDEDQPDIIVVSYGGNDFHGGNKEIFEQDSVLFCQNLRDMYPTAKIIVMMPFCNGSRRKNEPLWYFCELQDHLRGLSERIENLTVVESSDFVPDDSALFHSDGVHPLDAGHDIHFCGIVSAIQQQI
jgi:lysophospholipase L1-like esterase